MVSERVEMRGHIIDSLLLPRVLDEITARDGRFEVEHMDVGRRRQDPSYARIRVEADDAETLEEILRRVQKHGADLLDTGSVVLQESPADGVFPEQFHVTS